MVPRLLVLPLDAGRGFMVWEVDQERPGEYSKLPTGVSEVDKILNFVLAVAGKIFFEARSQGMVRGDNVGFVTVREETGNIPERIIALPEPRFVISGTVTVLVVAVENVAFPLKDTMEELFIGVRHEVAFAFALDHASFRVCVIGSGTRGADRLHLTCEGGYHNGALGVSKDSGCASGKGVEARKQIGVRPEIDVS